ncbi:MAG: helix-turn-helix domain-containing protein [Gammaproteobacteria bacterium]|nr:helix-turn-helix domain-containing protein [Gammaproteobacteria bacterium]
MTRIIYHYPKIRPYELLTVMIDTTGPDTHIPQHQKAGRDASIRQEHPLTDAFTQGRLQHWVDIEVHQLGAGIYQGACTTLSSGRMHLVHEQQNRLIHKTGALQKNRCTISFALGRDPLKRFSHFLEPAPVTFLLPDSSELDILVPAQVDTLYLCLEQDRLMAGARKLNPRFWERPPQGLQAFNTPETGRLVAGLMSLLSLEAADVLSAQTERLLMDSVLLALDQATEVQCSEALESKAHHRAMQRVNAAREYIDASIQEGQVPSMVDLCAHTYSSARTLQYAFRKVMQMTPVTYLRILRLNKVRSTLNTADTAETTVTQMATRWGFLHLGEFARDYQRLFGERPSETLARSSARKLA